MKITRFVPGCCGLVALLAALPAAPGATAFDGPRPAAMPVAAPRVTLPEQYIDAQQLRIDCMEGEEQPSASLRPTVTAWQVSTGRWNGQLLDGLSLVLVQNGSSDRACAAAIYISDFATCAQREALLAAISAAHPDLFGPRDGAYRIEPACIRIEQLNGSKIVLHVATVAALAVGGSHVG